jgi:hypothetical protein
VNSRVNNLNFYHTWNGAASSFQRSDIESMVRDTTHLAVREILEVS